MHAMQGVTADSYHGLSVPQPLTVYRDRIHTECVLSGVSVCSKYCLLMHNMCLGHSVTESPSQHHPYSIRSALYGLYGLVPAYATLHVHDDGVAVGELCV